ncbi:MAG: inositol monophosphatase family protein [bacterium]|nr:inositol monophosphatase family protein [bacterium]
MPHSAPLSAALRAARAAAAMLRKALADHEPLRVDHKGRHDYVTQVDRRSEELIVSLLRADCPEIGLLGEEGAGLDLEADRIWAVDPLDGTSNFIHGYPAFAVSIGLLERVVEPEETPGTAQRTGSSPARFPQVRGRQPVLGVIADVCQRRLYHAWQGGGAWVADLPDDPALPLGLATRLRVGQAPVLEEAFLATGFPIRHKDLARLYLGVFDALMPPSAGIRRGGSAALDLAYTAAGVFDGFVELQLAPWDTAAGLCLITEAGGCYAGLGGDPLVDGHLAAGNPALVAELLGRLTGRL